MNHIRTKNCGTIMPLSGRKWSRSIKTFWRSTRRCSLQSREWTLSAPLGSARSGLWLRSVARGRWGRRPSRSFMRLNLRWCRTGRERLGIWRCQLMMRSFRSRWTRRIRLFWRKYASRWSSLSVLIFLKNEWVIQQVGLYHLYGKISLGTVITSIFLGWIRFDNS